MEGDIKTTRMKLHLGKPHGALSAAHGQRFVSNFKEIND